MIWFYFWICAVICYLDIKHRWIPDLITIPASLAVACFFPERDVIASMVGFLIGFGCLYLSGIACMFISEKHSVGGGDIKLLAMIGAFWGWQAALMTFAIAPYLGFFYAATMNKNRIPYGVFLIIASLIPIIMKGQI